MYLEKMKIGEKTIISQSEYAPLSDEIKSKFTYKSIGNNLAELTRASKRYKTESVRSQVFKKLAAAGIESIKFDDVDTLALRVYVSAYNRKHNDVFVVKETTVCRDMDKAMKLTVLSQQMFFLIEVSIYKRMNDLQFKVEGFDVTMPFPFENIKERIKQMESVKHVEVMESVSEVVKTESEINLQVDNLEFIESTEIQTETEIEENDFED